MVLPALLYACEICSIPASLQRLHRLRKLLYIKRQGKIPDPEVLKKAGVQSMHSVLKLAQLRWTGYVIRMPDERLPKTWATSKDSLLSNLWRITGGKALSRWPEEMLHRNPQSLSEGFRHTMGSWKQTAQERSTWRGLVNKGAALYEKRASVKLKESTENAKAIPIS